VLLIRELHAAESVRPSQVANMSLAVKRLHVFHGTQKFAGRSFISTYSSFGPDMLIDLPLNFNTWMASQNSRHQQHWTARFRIFPPIHKFSLSCSSDHRTELLLFLCFRKVSNSLVIKIGSQVSCYTCCGSNFKSSMYK
jgi:hypothetical protein